MSNTNKDEDDDFKMITVNEPTAKDNSTKMQSKKKKNKHNLRPKRLAKKIDTMNKCSKNKKKKAPKSESTIRRRKIKKLKQKLKDISKLKQIYGNDKSLLTKEQILKMKDEENIRSELESIKGSHGLKYNNETNENNENKSFPHARKIANELQFISQQINSTSQQLNEYINTNNIRTIETYIGNMKNSLLTLYSRMTTLINELDLMQYIPLRYIDNPNKPSIYFKNEYINNQKPFKFKNNNQNKYFKSNRQKGIKIKQILSNDEMEKRALKKRKELKLKTHIFDNHKFFINRFESFGISHKNVLQMMAQDGRIPTQVFKKIAGDLIYKYNWNNNELFFSCVQGIVPHSRIYCIDLDVYLKQKGTNYDNYRIQNTKILHKQLYKMQCGPWVANQLEKISLLVNNGNWNLDCNNNNNNNNNINGYIGWSQLLWNMNLDQYYSRVICFIHDYMNGQINFIDQNNRSLAHFACCIYPVNMAYKLCVEMSTIGYNFGLPDMDGIKPVTIFYYNMLKSYKNIVNTKNNNEFKQVSGIIIQWTLDSCDISRNLPIEIVNTIIQYGHYTINDIKNRNNKVQTLFINKWIYASIHKNEWKIMLQTQKKRLNKIKMKEKLYNEKFEKKLKLKQSKKENRINKEKKRLYLLENKNNNNNNNNNDIEMNDKWKDFEIPIEKQKELQEKELKNLMIKAKKNKKKNARKKRKKQIKEKIKMENEMEKLNEIKKKPLLQQLVNETGVSKIADMKTDKMNYKMSETLRIKDSYHENVHAYINHGRGGYRGGDTGRGRGRGRGRGSLNQYTQVRNTQNMNLSKSNVALNRGNRVKFNRPLYIGRYQSQDDIKENDIDMYDTNETHSQ